MEPQMIVNLAFAFIIAFLFSWMATPLVIKLAPIIGTVDIPKDERRMHTKPMPLAGGIAIYFGFLVSVLCFSSLSKTMIATLIGASVVVVVGVLDDRTAVSARVKLLFQIIAALIVVVWGDVKIDVITNPNFFSESAFIMLNDWISIPLTVLWIVAITNAVNLIDGLDGLAVGVSTIASVSLVFIALRVGEPAIALVALALMGACFGFLPFNFNPAKIFMGDTGALFLGFMLSVLSVQGAFKSYAFISFAVPILILGLPIFDTGFAVVRRLFNGQGIATADRGHMHHRLIDFGFSQKQAVFILYAVSGVLGLTAVVMAEYGALRALLLLICVIIFVFAGTFVRSKKNEFDKNNEDSDEHNDGKK